MIKFNSLKAILFDLGDTLISFKKSFPERERQISKNIHRVLSKFGYLISEEDYYQKKTKEWGNWKRGHSLLGKEFEINDFFPTFLKKLDINTKDAIRLTPLIIDIIYENDLRYVELKPSVKKTLDKIQKMSFLMGIITNSSYSHNHILEILKYLEISEYFNVVIVSSELKICKPNPKIFIEALNKLNVSPEDAICVGNDLEIDIRGAAKAGIRGILVNSYQNEKNKYKKIINNYIVVEKINEILDYL